uniref:Variant surface glycoprotein 1125.1152 n=1 Tax=Trypanosoma brucei TaxID=5691 RepID=A0A1J0R4H3_9TRYP|nr:variant surface glycoprotein 1125.1152 [Trypanosoma brucei]
MFISISLYVTLLTAPVLHRSATAATQDGVDDAGQKVTDSCGEIRYDLALASLLRRQAAEGPGTVQRLSHNAAALRLAAAAATCHRAAGLRALALMDEQVAQAALSRLGTYSKTLGDGAAALQARAHRLIMYRRLRIKSLTPGTATQAANEQSPAATTVVTTNTAVTKTIKDDANCSIDDLNGGHNVRQGDVRPNEIYKLKMFNDALIKQATITLKAAVKGNPAAGHNAVPANPGFVDDDGTIGNSNYLGALGSASELTETTAEISIFDTATKRGGCKAKATNSHWDSLVTAEVARAVCRALNEQPLNTASILQRSWSDIEAGSEIAMLIALQLNQPFDKDDNDKGKTKALIKSALGSTSTVFFKDFVEYITTKEHSFQIGDDKINGKLTDLASGPKVAKLLAYLKVKLTQQCCNQQGSTTITPSAEVKKCKTIAEKNKCKTEDGCKLKDENYVEAENGKGGKKRRNVKGN